MKTGTYRIRTHKELEKALAKAVCVLQMRDWELSLETGAQVPDKFAANHINAGATIPQAELLKADIWINTRQCKEQDLDPLETLYHELFHIWIEYCDNEERMCNILASLMSRIDGS